MLLASLFKFCIQESWLIFKLAFPIYLATLMSEVNNSFIPLIFAGHFGNTTTNYAAIALSLNFLFFTGTVPHMCLSSALNTLATQAYGEGRNKYIGTLYQRSVWIHLLMCLPIAVIWLNTTNILTILGQKAELSILTGEYLTVYICVLPAYAILYPTMKILQIQDIVLPSTVIFVVGCALEGIVCYLLLFQTNMGVRGLACGVLISVYFMGITHLVYFRTMSVWGRVWDGLKWDAFERWGQYIYYGMPTTILMWIEIMVFYCGTYLLGATSVLDPVFEISVYSIVNNLDLFLYLLSFAFQSVVSIRIGILVGERNIVKLRYVAILSTVLIIIAQFLQVIVLIAGRSMWGYIFTSDEKVVHAVASVIYILAAFLPMDGIVGNFQGILVGMGEQKIGIIISIVFFVVTIPISVLITIFTKLGALGYWLGILIGMGIRTVSMLPIAFCWIDWKNIVTVDGQSQMCTVSIESSEEELEIPRNTCKKTISILKFKVLFAIIFIIIIIANISCKVLDSKVEIFVENSYIKFPIDFCCVRLSTSHNYTSNN